MGRPVRRLAFLVVVACAATLWSTAPVLAQSNPSCSTFNERNEPSSSFGGGEKIIVRGTGFGSRSLVFVRFEQGSRSRELGRPTANDLGAFAMGATALPTDATDGSASIQALDARGAATCEITLTGSASDDGSSLGGLYAVWGTVLGVFAIVLVVLTYRRWKSERLNAAMDKLSFGARRAEHRAERAQEKAERAQRIEQVERAPEIAPAIRQTWELDPWEQEAADARRAAEADAPSPVAVTGAPSWKAPVPAAAPDEDDERWFDPEADEASVKDPRLEQASSAEIEEAAAEEPELVPVPDPEVVPENEPVPDPVREPDMDEPPRLPVGWDADRLGANRQTSDAIARLRREVKTWGRS